MKIELRKRDINIGEDEPKETKPRVNELVFRGHVVSSVFVMKCIRRKVQMELGTSKVYTNVEFEHLNILH